VQFKKIYPCLIFVFALLPIATSYSQTSLYELRTGRSGIGIGLSTTEDIRAISGTLDYGIDSNLRISFSAGVALIDDYEDDDVLEVPPSPIGAVSITRVDSLSETGLDYFLIGSFNATYSEVIDTSIDETFIRTRALGLTGGGGIFKRLDTESGWILKPYFGIYSSNLWTLVINELWDDEETDTSNSLLGEVGIEIEMSRTTSIVGSFGFSFQNSDTSLGIAINFH